MSSLPPAWRRALPGFLVLLVGILLLSRATGLAMVEIWDRSETFAHAFVVPPLALWLIWRQRALLAQQTPQPQAIFLLPMAGCALLWLVGDLAAVNAATQFAFTGMLVLTVPTALGWPVARCIAFPLGFLFFAVPFGEFLMQPMMELTADFTIAALRASGIPVFREGLQFIIPSGNWSVVEACSGIRYLMASVMVGALFAYLNYRSMTRRWIFVAISIALAVLANWLRAYMIVMLGHFSGNKLAAGADHLVYGWVLFGIIMLALFMIGARWAEPDSELSAAPLIAPGAAAPRRLGVLMLTALLILAPLLARVALEQSGSQARFRLEAPDLVAQGWRPSQLPVADFKPAFANPVADLQAGFERDGGPGVGVYLAYYRQQGPQSKLISSHNVLVDVADKQWAQVTRGARELALGGQLPSWRTAELRGAPLGSHVDARRLQTWQLYWINGRWIAADWEAKIHAALGRLLGQGDDGAVLVLYASKGDGQDGQGRGGDELIQAFVQDNGASLDAWLRRTRADNQSK